MHLFDASSIIHAWDNYPIVQLPQMWDWLAALNKSREIQIPRVAFVEVKGKVPECGEWLMTTGIEIIDMRNEILTASIMIKRLLGIVADNYHPNGIDENDIFIIATAHVMKTALVTDEKVQVKLPDNIKKYKIPAVCNLKEIQVDCLNFLEFFKRSGKVFR